MKNKSLFFLITIAILMIALVIFVMKPEKGNIEDLSQSNHPGLDHKQNASSDADAHIDQLALVKSTSKNADPLIVAIEPNAVRTLIIPEHFKNHEDGFLFSFDDATMASKKVGDEFGLKMLQFEINRNAVIESVDQIEDDIVKFQGKFEGYPADLNYFTITQSVKDRYAVMKVFTDKGSYIAEIKDGIGLAKPEVSLSGDELHEH